MIDFKNVWKFYIDTKTILKRLNIVHYKKSKTKKITVDIQIIAQKTQNSLDSFDVDVKLAEYKLNLEKYRHNENKIRLIKVLINYWVDFSIRDSFQIYNIFKNMINYLVKEYKMSNEKVFDIFLDKMKRLRLQNKDII